MADTLLSLLVGLAIAYIGMPLLAMGVAHLLLRWRGLTNAALLRHRFRPSTMFWVPVGGLTAVGMAFFWLIRLTYQMSQREMTLTRGIVGHSVAIFVIVFALMLSLLPLLPDALMEKPNVRWFLRVYGIKKTTVAQWQAEGFLKAPTRKIAKRQRWANRKEKPLQATSATNPMIALQKGQLPKTSGVAYPAQPLAQRDEERDAQSPTAYSPMSHPWTHDRQTVSSPTAGGQTPSPKPRKFQPKRQ